MFAARTQRQQHRRERSNQGKPRDAQRAGCDDSRLSLAQVLPNTGTIGELIAFLFTFVYSPPYKPFIPLDGIREDLPFVRPPAVAEICNEALVRYRLDLQNFIVLWAADSKVPGPPAQINQWELSIET